jgi:ribose transport system substrate-binding protein
MTNSSKSFGVRGRAFRVVATAAVMTVGATGSAAPVFAAAPRSPNASSVSIDYILGVVGSPFYEAMACGAQVEAKSLGVKVTISAPSEYAADKTLPILDAAISAHPSAIVLVPNDETALDLTAAQVGRHGIKLVTADGTLANGNQVATTQVLSDNVAGGKQVANEMAKEIGGRGDVLLLTTEPGLSLTQDQRSQGFREALKAYPGIRYVGAQYANDQPEVSASEVRAELARYPKLAGIFADNDQAGIGAASGLASAHASGRVKLWAYDAAVSEVQSLRQRVLQGTIAQEPAVEGQDAVKYAVAAVEGKTVPKTVYTPTQVLTTQTPLSVDLKYEYKSSC